MSDEIEEYRAVANALASWSDGPLAGDARKAVTALIGMYETQASKLETLQKNYDLGQAALALAESEGKEVASRWATAVKLLEKAERERNEARSRLDAVREAISGDMGETDLKAHRRVLLRIQDIVQGTSEAPPERVVEDQCQHQWVDPTNPVVQANGHELCVKCGALRDVEAPLPADPRNTREQWREPDGFAKNSAPAVEKQLP